jgi:predicted RNA-binding Zn ribbon-like protein|tara:strand:+ start:1649 stop:2293 length:645 start_codon:yes stop_codon:yes gene_type:complete
MGGLSGVKGGDTRDTLVTNETVALGMSGVNMVFIHDTEMALRAAVDLVNTLPLGGDDDTLTTADEYDAFLARYPYSGTVSRTRDEHEAVRAIRSRLRTLWGVDRESAVPIVNAMLRDGEALPQLVIHDEYDWHVHASDDDAPLATRILVETAMAFVEVIRMDEYDRVLVCEADDCEGVLVDFSRNRSKRYCDTGNCGNRMNVIAYRARRAQETS